ncbi:MAG: hypothetical protein HQP61_07905 [Peptococcaceae bacterium]|nr:hypothetical protein [Candidatus Syntrophopropionicum ammoniitolerans]
MAEENTALQEYNHAPEQTERLLALFKEVSTEDPVLVWYVREGAPAINDIRSRLAVSNIGALVSLVYQLEYYHNSFIVDVPERLSADFSELDLLSNEDKIHERGFSRKLIDIKRTWVEDAGQLGSWDNIHSSIIHTNGVFYDAVKYLEMFVIGKDSLMKIETIEPIKVGIEGIKINVNVANGGRTDGQAETCAASNPAA